MYPRYTYPIHTLAGLVRDGLLSHRRSFADDARACMARLRPQLEVIGAQNIAAGLACVITPNHYYRPGFASQWATLAISSCMPADVHWAMAAELTFPGHWIAPLGMPVSRFVMGRIAAAYGFTAMPPMPPRPRDVGARAVAVRALLRYAFTHDRPVIGLALEGGDQPGGRLSMPPPGAGRFCLLLAGAGLSFLPVGVYEGQGRLTLHFGRPYTLCLEQCSGAERDRRAAFSVMSHIAPLIPAELRGEFSGVPPNEASTPN